MAADGTLSVMADGIGLHAQEVSSEDSEVEVVLRNETLHCSVRIKDAGTPVLTGVVSLIDDASRARLATSRVSAHGGVRFQAPANRAVKLLYCDDRSVPRGSVTLPKGWDERRQVVTIWIPVATSLAGLVLSADEWVPVEGASIAIAGLRRATSDSMGRFIMPTWTPEYEPVLVVAADGYASKEICVDGPPEGLAQPIVVPLERGRRVQGRVTGVGLDEKECIVEIRESWTSCGNTVVHLELIEGLEQDGSFLSSPSLGLRDLTISVISPGWPTSRRFIPGSSARGDVIDVGVIHLRLGRVIVGTAVSEGEIRVRECYVTATRVDGNEGRIPVRPLRGAIGSSGAFAFPALALGRWRIALRSTDGAILDVTDVSLEPGQTPIEVNLVATHSTASLRLVDQYGNGITGLSVEVQQVEGDGSGYVLSSTFGGHVLIPAVSIDTEYRVIITDRRRSGDQATLTSTEVVSFPRDDGRTITLDEGWRLTVTIRSSQGVPESLGLKFTDTETGETFTCGVSRAGSANVVLRRGSAYEVEGQWVRWHERVSNVMAGVEEREWVPESDVVQLGRVQYEGGDTGYRGWTIEEW
jgi:hypothetical protein